VTPAARLCSSAAAPHAKQSRTLFFMEKFIKLVSTRTWYGGPSCVLYLKKSAVGVFSLPSPGQRPPSPQLASMARRSRRDCSSASATCTQALNCPHTEAAALSLARLCHAR